MKLKAFILAAGMVAFVSCGPSYRITDHSIVGVTVPPSVQTAFNHQYPAAINVTWSMYDAENTPIDWDMTGCPF